MGQSLFPEGAAPSTPSAGYVAIYAKTDGYLYQKDDSGTETRMSPDTTQITDKIQPITASVGSNAMTVTLNPTTLDFRSATLGSGTVATRVIGSAISVTIPSTATMGTVNAVANRIAVLAIDNAGTVELAVVNLAGGNQLDETNLITTTTIDTAADSASTIYSTTGRTNVAYRVVGIVESTQATAGTWATAPSLIQGTGGNAVTAMSSIGYGQTWQNVTGSRALGTTYYNTTGKPIMAKIRVTTGVSYSAGTPITLTVNGEALDGFINFTSGQNYYLNGDFIIPPGASYVCSASNTSLGSWKELR